MSKNKLKVKNPIVIKILIIVGVLLSALIITIYSFSIVYKSMHVTDFDLGERQEGHDYADVILTDYNMYKKLMESYNVPLTIKKDKFSKYYYVASFQDYDTCGEKKIKSVDSVSVNDSIKITYKVYNTCGWCKRHVSLHLVRIPKTEVEMIEYDYKYAHNINCGSV